MERIGLKLEGSIGAACARTIERAIACVPGVVELNVNFDLKLATVGYDRQATTAEAIIQAVTTAGYQATSIEPSQRHSDPSTSSSLVLKRSPVVEPNYEIELFWAIVISLLLTIGSLSTLLNLHLNWVPDWLQHPIGQFILATVVQFWCGRSIFIDATNTIWYRRRMNLNTLVAVSTGAAYCYSTIDTFFAEIIDPGYHSQLYIYFHIAALTIALTLCGDQLERWSEKRTKTALQHGSNCQPQVVRMMNDSQERSIPIYQACEHQIVTVFPREVIPVDGVILAGESKIDRSLVTGESQLVTSKVGDEVSSRAINHTQTIEIGITKTNDRTFLAQIGQLVDRIRADKLPMPRLADRIATPIMAIAIAIAIVTSSIWLILTSSLSLAMMTGIGVLILACPAVWGLATAIAISIGMRQGLARGIAIKSSVSLEVLGRVNTIVFDKTGTLTTGRSIVTNFIPVVDRYHGNELEIFQLAASVLNCAQHPLASAIIERAQERQLLLKPVTQFQENIGNGASGIVDRQLIQVGTSEWIDALNINTVLQATNHQILTNYQHQWEAVGNTVMWIAIDREIAGIVGMSDEIKPTAIATISRLKKLGLAVVLLTGDRLANTDPLARQLGIDRVFTQVDPQGKAQIVKTLQTTAIGHPAIVAMVGDGINDAPALAQADIGIAIHTATDIAIAASELTIGSPDLQAIVTSIKLGRSTLTNIKQNLVLAAIAHLLCIPIAAGSFYPGSGWLLNPAIVSGATIVSLVLVSINASRLRRFKG